MWIGLSDFKSVAFRSVGAGARRRAVRWDGRCTHTRKSRPFGWWEDGKNWLLEMLEVSNKALVFHLSCRYSHFEATLHVSLTDTCRGQGHPPPCLPAATPPIPSSSSCCTGDYYNVRVVPQPQPGRWDLEAVNSIISMTTPLPDTPTA